MCLLAALDSQGIVVRCTAAIIFRAVDCVVRNVDFAGNCLGLCNVLTNKKGSCKNDNHESLQSSIHCSFTMSDKGYYRV